MLAIELTESGGSAHPATAAVKKIVQGCVERGLLVISAGEQGNVIRILSPLVITDEELARGLDILEEEIVRHAPRVAGAKPVAAGIAE
jgi:4-aminobutyrate aminotransferase/(S)-3-amino-2-methylpropionate transaminase